MGETSDYFAAHGGPGMVLCGRTGVFVADTAMCKDCPRRVCRSAQPGSTECNECKAECPDWEPDEDDGS